MTERLYYDDPHLIDFTARVLRVEPANDDRTLITLDRTAFYPVGGGQPHDIGTLGGAEVVDCTSDEQGDVIHTIRGTPPALDTEIVAHVDRARRRDHIQQHTAQHILSRALLDLFDAPTEGFRMSETDSEIDIRLADPIDTKLEDALALANEIVWQNRAINIRYMTEEEAASAKLRRRFERTGTLRVIEIDGFDRNPCGGTHAEHTGEVGIILIKSLERAKGLTRITFVAGARAARDYARTNRTARAVADLFSVARDDVPAAARRLIDDHKEIQRRLRQHETIAAAHEADDLRRTAERLPDGTRLIRRRFTDRDAESLKTLAQNLIRGGNDGDRTIALLASDDHGTARLVFARTPDARGDMNQLMRNACTLLDGRGGGKPDLAQGGGRDATRIDSALDDALAQLITE